MVKDVNARKEVRGHHCAGGRGPSGAQGAAGAGVCGGRAGAGGGRAAAGGCRARVLPRRAAGVDTGTAPPALGAQDAQGHPLARALAGLTIQALRTLPWGHRVQRGIHMGAPAQRKLSWMLSHMYTPSRGLGLLPAVLQASAMVPKELRAAYPLATPAAPRQGSVYLHNAAGMVHAVRPHPQTLNPGPRCARAWHTCTTWRAWCTAT